MSEKTVEMGLPLERETQFPRTPIRIGDLNGR